MHGKPDSTFRGRARGLGLLVACALCVLARPARADEPLSNLAEGSTRSSTRATITFSGWVEAFYQWNFNTPSNGITNDRGFDNRHDSFTIDNAVLDVIGVLGPVAAHVALQVGLTPETYYSAEPVSPGGAGAGSSGPNLWKYIQQANLGWTAPLGRGLLVEAGLFLSPIGPEGLAVKDQWNWSRSTLFFGLPYYHAGVRVAYPFTDRIVASIGAFNGWNNIVDNNPEKSLAAQLTYNVPDKVTVNFVYFTGVERSPGSPAGSPWRHLFDLYAAYHPLPWLSLLAHADAGFEPGDLGISSWAAGALYARFRPAKWLYVATRGDFYFEHTAHNNLESAGPVAYPVEWVSSATLTFDLRPADNLSFRVEYRHDQAAADLYYKGLVPIRIQDGLFIPNARGQDTLTAGATAWF